MTQSDAEAPTGSQVSRAAIGRRVRSSDAAATEAARTRRVPTRSRATRQAAPGAATDQTTAPARSRRVLQKQQASAAPAESAVPTQAQPPGAATPTIVEQNEQAPVDVKPEKPRPAVDMTAAHADAAIRFTSMLLQQGLFRDANTVLEEFHSLFAGNEKLSALLAISRYCTNQHRGVLDLANVRFYEQPGELYGFWPLIEHLATVANGDDSQTVNAAERFITATSVQQTQLRSEKIAIEGETGLIAPPESQ